MHQAGPGSSGSHPRFSTHFVRRQHAALAALTALSRPEGRGRADLRSLPGLDNDRLRQRDNPLRRPRPVRLAPREKAPGALNDSYEIPTITFRHKKARGVFLSTLLVGAVIFVRLISEIHHSVYVPLVAAAAPIFLFRAVSWLVSWRDEPVVVGRRAQEFLDRLCVVVTVPVYNEDPALLDRCLFALVNQSRPPQRIDVVDDGSKLDYSALEAHWTSRVWAGGTVVHWRRQRNQGKRRAHALTFATSPEADIFVTVDSDTSLEHNAIDEGLKPFIDTRVMSVAGIEMGFNASLNFLTRMQSSLQLFSQVVMGSAWSVMGDMYTNRGPFALYRAVMVREIIELYANETFFGRRVILGDDSLLALCATARGRSVQQLSAFGLTMWPESLGHHMRQRLRWARGRAVRNFWRLKYRPFFSYIWWYTFIGIYTFLMGCSLLVLVIAMWPQSARIVAHLILALFLWGCLNQFRAFCFSRSDERWSDKLLLMLMRPLTSLWSAIMLAKIIRFCGTVTCLRQGWTTRQQGAELVLAPMENEAAA
jgi:hyaluronan synthase